MNRPMTTRTVAGLMVFVLTYSPFFAQYNGTLASAQAVQNTTYAYQYDAAGNLIQVTDPLGRVSNQSYDPLNRVKQQLQPAPLAGAPRPVTNFTYDGLDQLATVSDPRTLATTYTTDGLGNRTALSSPDTGLSGRTYDLAGNMLTYTDARGKLTSYTYDALNRMTGASYASGTPTLYEYDGGPGGAANLIGRLTKMSDESGYTTYAYDSMGRVLTVAQTTNGAGTALVRQVSYAYDSAGRLASLTYPSGNRVNYAYNSAGQVIGLSLNPADAAGGTDTAISTVLLGQIVYTPTGAPQSWAWGNSTAAAPNVYARSYDLDGRVASYPLGNLAGTVPGLLRTLSYDAAGNITAMTHTGGANASSFDQGFVYDALNRLTGVTNSTGAKGYAYDASGNRTQASFGGVAYTATTSVTSNRLNSTAGPAPAKTNTFDDAGNLKSDGTVSYTYSDRGRLSSIVNGSVTASYRYNGLGQRVTKTRNLPSAGTDVYAYDQAGHVLGEYSDAGAVQQETVYFGDMPVAVLRPALAGEPAAPAPAVYYIYADQINTPRLIASAATGNVVWRWDAADPFGVAQPDENPAAQGQFVYNLRFPGQLYDKETNNHYNYFRDYDPQTGRYIQSDPIGLEGGINTYAYVRANPVTRTDPLGLTDIVYHNSGTFGGTIWIYDKDGNIVGAGPAANNTDSKSRGPWAKGVYNFSHNTTHPDDGPDSGFGSNGNTVFNVPGCVGCGVHSGRKNKKDGAGRSGVNHATQGCIRTTDEVTGVIRDQQNNGDPVSTLTVDR